MDRRALWILIISVLCGGLLIFFIVRGAQLNTPVKIGDMAPDIETTTVTGEPFKLDSLRGKPVLLNFFTTWCPPCIEETPSLIGFAKKYGSVVHVVLIDRGEDQVMVRHYVAKYHLPRQMTVLLSQNDKWSAPYGVTGQPESFFITPDGKVVQHLLGPLTTSQMIHYARLAGLHN